MARAWLSLGSNMDAKRHLDSALAELRTRFGAVLESDWYRTRAVGFEGPDFINLAVGIDTDVDPIELDAWLHEVEARHGRDRTQPRYASRTLDIDLVLYGDRVIEGPGSLQLPRAELARGFVLRPLCDIAPQLVPPDGDSRSILERWNDLRVAERETVTDHEG